MVLWSMKHDYLIFGNLFPLIVYVKFFVTGHGVAHASIDS